jgi:Trypsin-like peptidase domain
MLESSQERPLRRAALVGPDRKRRGSRRPGIKPLPFSPMVLTALGLLLVGLAAGPVGEQQLNDIFLINADNLRDASGFKIQNKQGQTRIVTALHAVAGFRKELRASNAIQRLRPGTQRAEENPNHKNFNNLEIREVDFDRDLVMLGSNVLDREPGGLSVAWNADLQGMGGRRVTIIGYPYSLYFKEIDTPLWIRHEPLAPLKFLANGDTREFLVKRGRSPSLEALMLSLDGSLLPGHSGAPIFDDQGRVIAVGCGGLGVGVGLVWASPLVDRFEPASDVRGRLNALVVPANQLTLFALGRVLRPTPPDAAGPLETEIINLTSSPNPSPSGENIAFYAQVRVRGQDTAATGAVRFYYVGEEPPAAGANPEKSGRFLSDAELLSGTAQSYRATPPFRLPGRYYFMAVYHPNDRKFAPCVSAFPLEQRVREPGPR